MAVCKTCGGDGCVQCYGSGFTGDHTDPSDRLAVLQRKLRNLLDLKAQRFYEWDHMTDSQRYLILIDQINDAREELAHQEERFDSDQSYDHFHDDPDDRCG